MIALVRDREGQARISDALHGRAELVMTAAAAEFELAVREHAAKARILIATPTDAADMPVLPRLARIRSLVPAAALIGYFRNGYSEEQEILAFARAQMSGMAFRHVTDTRVTLGAVIARGMHATVAEEVMKVLRPRLSPVGARFVAYGLQHAYERATVQELASAFGRHRKTITSQCIAAGLPVPGALLTWCRFLVLGYLLDRGSSAVDELVLTLDFASSSALRTQLKRYTGRRPLELREAGALDSIIAAFLDPGAMGRVGRSPLAAGAPSPSRRAGDAEVEDNLLREHDKALR